MTERPYETTVPDDLTFGTTSPTAASGDYTAGSTSQSQGTAGGKVSGVADQATSEAKSVASDAKDSGQQVAQTAASGAKDVAAEASNQARQLFTQLRGELDDQASSQGQRAAQGVRSLADELRQMASSSEQQGIAGQAVGQVADRAHSVADWIENRQPGEMLEELRSLARRRPGAFLLGAAVLGVVGGRLTRGLTSDGSSSGNGSAQTGAAYTGTAGYSSTGGAGGAYGTMATQTSAAGAIPPSESPVRSEPYTVGVRDSDTHAVTSMTGGVTAHPVDDPLDESYEPIDPIDETFPENRGGVR